MLDVLPFRRASTDRATSDEIQRLYTAYVEGLCPDFESEFWDRMGSAGT